MVANNAALTQTTSFSPDANVIPRLGTLRSQKNRYIDVKIRPEDNRPTLVAVSVPQPGRMEEGVYDRVYEDGTVMEEVYDSNINRDVGPGSTEVLQDAEWPNLEEESASGSVESGSTNTSKIAVDDFVPIGSFTLPRGEVRHSVEVAANPLYDQLKRQMLFNEKANHHDGIN